MGRATEDSFELVPDEQTMWTARRILATLPEGPICLAGVREPMPVALSGVTRKLQEIAATGNPLLFSVRNLDLADEHIDLVRGLIEDGKLLRR